MLGDSTEKKKKTFNFYTAHSIYNTVANVAETDICSSDYFQQSVQPITHFRLMLVFYPPFSYAPHPDHYLVV